MIEVSVNAKETNTIQRKSVINIIKRTCQTHSRAIMIHLKIVTIDASDTKRSIPVETPDLLPFRDPPVQTYRGGDAILDRKSVV